MLEGLGGSGGAEGSVGEGLTCLGGKGGTPNFLFEVLVKLLNGLSMNVLFLESFGTLLEALGWISGYLVVKVSISGVVLLWTGWGKGIDVGEYKGVDGSELPKIPRKGGVPTL